MRIYRQMIVKHDLANHTELVRRLEMAVDAVVNDAGQIMQFWRDMDTYGLREAILYLENSGKASDLTKVKKVADEIAERCKR